jgi:hypothetical protein
MNAPAGAGAPAIMMVTARVPGRGQMSQPVLLRPVAGFDLVAEPDTHFRMNTVFARGQIISDGHDQIRVLARVTRQQAPFGAQPQPVGAIAVTAMILPPERARDFRVDVGPPSAAVSFSQAATVTVTSTRAILDTAAGHALQAPVLRIQGTAEGETLTPVDLPLHELHPHLDLWVVPFVSGSSLAFARCRVPDGRPLDVRVQIATLSRGAGTLSVTDTPVANAIGIASWKLTYQDLPPWTPAAGAAPARFEVRVGILAGAAAEPEEAVVTTIDIDTNLAALLAAFQDHRNDPALRTDNPLLSLNGAWVGRRLLDYAFPDFLSGPAWEVARKVASHPSVLPGGAMNVGAEVGIAFDQYSSRALRDRMHRWFSLRRSGFHGPDALATAATMNGIDVDVYTMPFLVTGLSHDLVGLHPAGSDPMGDPRFVDPWWRQDWSYPEYRGVAGLPTYNGERGRVLATAATIIPLTAIAAKFLVVYAGVAWLFAIAEVKVLLLAVTVARFVLPQLVFMPDFVAADLPGPLPFHDLVRAAPVSAQPMVGVVAWRAP